MTEHLSGSGSWDLVVHVADVSADLRLRVHGDMHVGGLVRLATESLDQSRDWSGHALFWPSERRWLTATRRTMDQCGLHAEARLLLTSIVKSTRVLLPDLRLVECRVDFAVSVFTAVENICDRLGIRHPEELSLARARRLESGDQVKVDLKIEETPDIQGALASDPAMSRAVAYRRAFVPRNPMHLTELHSEWLDSAKSLLEQGVDDSNVIHLRYKFLVFHFLKPSTDSIRINQIYQQAKWSILTEETPCGDNEAFLFAALQAWIERNDASEVKTGAADAAPNIAVKPVSEEDDDNGDEKEAPFELELSNFFNYLRPRRLGFNSLKKGFFVLKGQSLLLYETKEASTSLSPPLITILLTEAHVVPVFVVAEDTYAVRVFAAAASDGGGDDEPFSLRLEIQIPSSAQFAQWMAAFRVATRKSASHRLYRREMEIFKAFLRMQQPVADAPAVAVEPCETLSRRLEKKLRRSRLTDRIVALYPNVAGLTPIRAKMHYIRFWERLPGCGSAPFAARFTAPPGKKDELLGVAWNRLFRTDLTGRKILGVVRLATLTSWSVNWETKEFQLDSASGRIKFKCLSADPKIVHEFIGGYICLSMRTKQHHGKIDAELFHKLTGGRS